MDYFKNNPEAHALYLAKRKEKVECFCGKTHTRKHYRDHIITKAHIEYCERNKEALAEIEEEKKEKKKMEEEKKRKEFREREREKGYACDKCKKVFVSKWNRKKHMLKICV